MNKQQLLARLDYFDLVNTVTLRAIGTFSDDELGFQPRLAMRSPRQLIFHIYSQEQILAEAARQGRFTADMAKSSSPEESTNLPEIKMLMSVTSSLAYAKDRHQTAMDTFRSMSEEQVARQIESPFGVYPAWQYFAFAYDEHWHHRGQIYTYLRLLNKVPPDLYGY